MGLLDKLLGKKEAKPPSSPPEHLVLVQFAYGSTDLSRLFALEEAFVDRPDRHDGTIYNDGHFRLTVTRASRPLKHYFSMGLHSDRQSGGFIFAELLRNIAHCAEEKLGRIAAFRSKYQTWWLVLTDHIGFDFLYDHEKQELLEQATRPAGWDKIVVVSPRDPTRWFEF